MGVLLLTACHDDAGRAGQPGEAPLGRIDELQLIKAQPQPCAETSDCPGGSYCDPASEQCDWDCMTDSDCGAGHSCSAVGTCIEGISGRTNEGATCAGLPADERRGALLELAANDNPLFCIDDNDCICGAYCDQIAGSICRLQCLAPGLDVPAAPPELELGCGAGQVCSPLGQCVADNAPPPPSPPFMFTIETSDVALYASAITPVMREVKLSLVTNDLGGLSSSPAIVRVVIADELPSGTPRPRVKCAAGAPLADECTFNGGWQWNLQTSGVRSTPRSMWIEVPAVTAATTWSVEARSEWSPIPGLMAVTAEPFTIPATDPGRYTGTLIVPNGGAAADDNQQLTVPVEALVTATHVAILEPTRVFLPAGQAVISRDAAKATMLPWLTAAVGTGTSEYKVRLDLGALTYDSSNGHLAGAIALTAGTGNGADSLALSLDRAGDITAPACTSNANCPGAHCETVIGRCLPGPSSAGSIVDDISAAASPSTTLLSSRVAAWAPTLPNLIGTSNNKLGGTGTAGFSHAYCYRGSNQTAADFAATPIPQTPSGDLPCRSGDLGQQQYVQTTFPIVNRTTQFTAGTGGGNSFDLFQKCYAELDAAPGSSPLADKECVSPARFFLALEANTANGIGQPMAFTGQRLINQLLRQWLGVNAYAANTTIQLRDYDQALGTPGTGPAAGRLRDALDLVERGLRVMLDPRVRPQYRSGEDLAQTQATPDYRLPNRPFLRWTFNDPASPAQEIEGGSIGMSISASTAGSRVSCNLPVGGRLQSDEFELGEGMDPALIDDSRFSIVLNLNFANYPRGGSDTVNILDKTSPDRSGLWVEGKTNNPGKPDATLSLTLKDSDGGKVTFPPLPGDEQGHWGFLALVADGGTYRVYQKRPNASPIKRDGTVTGGGVPWGLPGTLSFGCTIPSSKTCTSFDRYHPGDLADLSIVSDSSTTPTFERSCVGSSCTGLPATQTYCNSAATSRRAHLVNALPAHIPPAMKSAVTVSGTLQILDHQSWYDEESHKTFTDTTWDCLLSTSNLPIPAERAKPVCGAVGFATYVDEPITYDEISLWARALTMSEFAAMATQYNDTASNESVAPKLTTPLPNTEQVTALPVHLLETASAHLDLVTEYVDAHRHQIYTECLPAGTSATRSEVLERAGRNLRLATVLEGEAVYLAELPGLAGASWLKERYPGARRQLAGRRVKVMNALERAGRCENPLGIAETDVPLFTGETVQGSPRGFVGTSYLIKRARSEIQAADQKLSAAQNAYVAQRQSQFQADLEAGGGPNSLKEQRLANLKAEFEGALRRSCGVSTTPLLPRFLAGTLHADVCFFKTEVPGCADAATKSVSSVPATCVRGELGSQLLAVQSAAIDVDNAIGAVDRAQAAYETQFDFCLSMGEFNAATQAIRTAHLAHMSSLRKWRLGLAVVQGLFNIIKPVKSLTELKNMLTPGGVIRETIGLGLGTAAAHLDNQAAEAEQKYRDELDKRRDVLALTECFHKADLQKFSIEAESDVVKRAAQASAVALANYETSRALVQATAEEAAGQLAIEQSLDRAPPQFHYWLDDSIEQFNRHMKHARRLSYLAVRAYEYEAQASIQSDPRAQTVAAWQPDQLEDIMFNLENLISPVHPGSTQSNRVVVLSLRTEILRLQDQTADDVPPGMPPLSSTEQFQRYLLSDAALIYDENHVLLGRGIRFSLRPGGFTQNSCSERVWRVVPSLSMSNAPLQRPMVVRQTNAFGSQVCGGGQGGDLQMTRVTPSSNLLRGEVDVVPFTAPMPYAQMNTDGLTVTREQLLDRPEDPNWPSQLAGRGLYGDYAVILLSGSFPPSTIANNMTDILLRFDFVERPD